MESKLNMGVSVVVCCYNSVTRLKPTLECLAKQNKIKDLKYEVLIIDNNSTDDTAQYAQNTWSELGSQIPLKISPEPMPGLSNARLRGVKEASFDYVLFCDDDNWLCDTYVQTAFEVMESNDQIGALGGWCDAAFEVIKPVWFDQFASNYAVAKQGESSGDITNLKGAIYGAGMVIRKSYWLNLENRGFYPLLTDRKGGNLSSGGDTEYCLALRLIGYKIWFDERLYFKHYMTEGRLNLQYLQKLRSAMSTANVELKCYIDELNERPLNRYFYIKKISDLLYRSFWKHLSKSLSNNLARKEKSKSYFRELRIMLFSYNSWLTNRRIIRAWLQSDPKDSL